MSLSLSAISTTPISATGVSLSRVCASCLPPRRDDKVCTRLALNVGEKRLLQVLSLHLHIVTNALLETRGDSGLDAQPGKTASGGCLYGLDDGSQFVEL